jgi:HK97 family phage portal protein
LGKKRKGRSRDLTVIPAEAKHAEGAWHNGPYYADWGWLPAGSAANWWQMGQNVQSLPTCSAMVEACVSAYSQTVAMCPGDHWRRLPNGGRERVTTSALTRIIRSPNDYQTISDFMMNGTREFYETGEVFALAIRNNRFEIAEMHLMRSRSCWPHVAETGEIFYRLGGNNIIERRFDFEQPIPARDVLHVRMHTRRDPLRGESPLMAVALDVAATNAALQQQIAFLTNQAKPSIMLSTDTVLTRDQVTELRQRWDAQTRGEFAGGTPILTAGLKPITVSTSAHDAQLAEMMKMSDQNVALAFRVPLQILGVGGTPFASTEALMQSWVATGLGFCLNHFEEAIGKLFGLAGFPDEYVEFSTKSLLRSSFREQIEGLSRSAISGLHSPDEARNELDLPTVPGGHGNLPRVQQQVVPLDWEAPAPAAPLALPAPEPDDEAEDAERTSPEDLLVRIYDHADRLH